MFDRALSYTSRVSTPLEPSPYSPYAEFAPAPSPSLPAVIDPDDPPWSLGAAFFTWLASIVLMVLINLAFILGYLVFSGGLRDPANLNATVQSDPYVTLTALISMIPTHIATLGVVWCVVTNFGRRPFWRTVGWGWSPRFGFWLSVLLAVLLLVFASVLIYFTGSNVETPLEETIKSSPAARFTTAFLAVVGAPLVEELVYRGVLYPAVQRALGQLPAIFIVGTLFTVVHVSQYYNNPAVIAAVGSLGFALTIVRARTGRVLPCFVIHLVFNGIQVFGLVFEHVRPSTEDGAAAPGALVSLVIDAGHALLLHL